MPVIAMGIFDRDRTGVLKRLLRIDKTSHSDMAHGRDWDTRLLMSAPNLEIA
jgi:hypothetical protein